MHGASNPVVPGQVAQDLATFFESRRDREIAAVYLFGSHARGAAHRDSDVDVAVLLTARVSRDARLRFERRLRLSSDLIAALHTDLVDVVILNDAPPLFARRILYTGCRVYGVDQSFERDFVRDTQLRAADLEPFLQRMATRKLAALAR